MSQWKDKEFRVLLLWVLYSLGGFLFLFLAPVLLAIAAFLSLSGCNIPPDVDGPYCDVMDTQLWKPANNWQAMDQVEWENDPEYEDLLAQVFSYQDTRMGNDVVFNIAVSPYAKILNSYDYLVRAPGLTLEQVVNPVDISPEELRANPLHFFATFVARNTPPTWFECGDSPNGSIATQWDRVRDVATVYYPGLLGLDKVYRAGVIVHEARHVNGRHRKEKPHSEKYPGTDPSVEYRGAYWYQTLYLAAIYYAPAEFNITDAERQAAGRHARSILKQRFVEPHDVTLESLSDIWNGGLEKYL
jgi:hypothetical protein